MANYSPNYNLYLPSRNDSDVEVDTSLTTNFTNIDNGLANHDAKLADISTNPRSFSAVGDGVTDDTTAIQNAANYASSVGANLLLTGNYRITRPITLKCGVVGTGKITIDSTTQTDMIIFDKDNTGTIVPISNITAGLSQGSKQLTGLNNYRGYTGVLISTDVMIERTGGQDAYYKHDSFRVVSDDGIISSPLDCTYTNTTDTLTLYPPDKPITIDNLRVEIKNINATANSIINIKRSDVTVKNMQVINNTSVQMQYVVNLTETVNVNFYNLKINGAMWYSPNPGIGYGVNIWNSSHVTLNECFIFSCRHSVSGRHAKDIKIKGGVHGNSIDSHWGSDYKISDCTIYVQPTYAGNSNYMAFLYCGSKISIENCTVYGGTYFLGLRDDTPELRDSVYIANNKWYPEASDAYRWFAFSIGDHTTNEFSRTLIEPENIIIEDNKLFASKTNASTGNTSVAIYYSNGFNRVYKHKEPKFIRIKDNQHQTLPSKFLEWRKNSSRLDASDTQSTKVYIQNMNANADQANITSGNKTTFSSIQILDYNSANYYAPVDQGIIDLYLDGIQNCYMNIDATVIREGWFKKSTFCYRVDRNELTKDSLGNYLRPTNCNYKFDECEFLVFANHDSTSFWFRLDVLNIFIRNNVFRSDMNFGNDSNGANCFNSQVYYANGNIKVSGKAFTGTMNGLVNAAYANS